MEAARNSQHQTWAKDPFDRSSSPFDYNASFVSFPTSICDEPMAPAFSSNDFAAPIFPFDSFASTPATIRYRYDGDTRQAYLCLARAMDYSGIGNGDRAIDLVRADALTYIEKLTLGQAATRRPRHMQAKQVRQKLQALVPEEFLISGCAQAEWCVEDNWVCADDTLANAAATYIATLKNKASMTMKNKLQRQCRTDTRRSGSRAMELPKKAEKELVDKTLVNVETWCDDWLRGKIDEADWDKMERCLST